jgi:hypothetical protein
MEKLAETFKQKEKELGEYQRKYKIRPDGQLLKHTDESEEKPSKAIGNVGLA